MSRRTIRSILALVLGPGLGAVRALPPAGGIVPGPGCPPARTEQVRGRSALALECPFEARPLERAFWDLPVRWDLRTAAGVRLELLCADTSPISQCNLYLRARGVWHAAALPVAGTGLWRTLRVLKTDFAPEGVSRGWGEVDRVRLAAWRGAGRDTVLHLGAVEILPGAAPLTLVRGSVSVPAAERGAAARYAREVMDAFVAVGVVPCCVDDVDLSEACLDPAHVTVLPYHPAMPDGAARALARTVERGGSVLGFYNLPGPLAEATGLRTGAYVRSTEVAAGIEGIVFQPGIVSGLPPALRQHSPNFLDIVPTGDRVRALGWWYDSRGGTTPHCAAALSPRGAWFGHVYLGQDSLAGPRLLLAVAGHFRPELWRLAVRGRIEAIPEGVASTDLPTTLAALEAYCRGNPRSRAALAHCARYHETARRLQASEQYAAALDFAEKSRAALLEAVIGLHRAPAGEFRGIWCHRGYGIEGWDWSRCAALLSGSGITAVFPNVANAAVADYASQVLQPSAVFRERGDQVAACLDACTPRGIEVHAWKICLNLGDRPDAALRESLLRAGRLQQDRDGGTRNWLCPSHPENRRAEVRAVEELVTRYPGLAGVHLDFIRFPGSGSCTCPSCRRAFEAQLGIRLTQWPREVA
ncbi:MAG: hypothetical protein JXR77_10535, partial [Lentisphaeria bacterium]|nr:hypothetical protein [Lentisphaeria bacterium]